jgi:hypothetical protein
MGLVWPRGTGQCGEAGAGGDGLFRWAFLVVLAVDLDGRSGLIQASEPFTKGDGALEF